MEKDLGLGFGVSLQGSVELLYGAVWGLEILGFSGPGL